MKKKFASLALLSALAIASITSAAHAEQVQPSRETNPSLAATETTFASPVERNKTLKVGKTLQLPKGYQYFPAVGWPKIIDVDADGLVTGKKKGNAVVEVKDGRELKYVYYITVN
ncbi:hypothetical protein SAMN04487970_10594 [Paenibacillus tianmuensis]|uniref:Ig-like domain (Group 2) n=1 Tax=Paenibacillus tianmuensis TaxID=624147 RepID=A0A1G4TN25_9BACL|nr:hypothetical protein [Paenibacillus tianmuensis]SCW82776.1 hypothetical protein SAMN04487970_10594 [Paenibacillus tianmuensis]